MEAMEQLKAGVKFNEVATKYSEDKARQGVSYIIEPFIPRLRYLFLMEGKIRPIFLHRF